MGGGNPAVNEPLLPLKPYISYDAQRVAWQ